ncbi:cytochrome P450 2J2-like [Diadema antillarum]|uniref:cytochrome P450 2J2-like n=1 Tax=Diadema antillarum TaxID=105358 RepID=UPI003A845FE7
MINHVINALSEVGQTGVLLGVVFFLILSWMLKSNRDRRRFNLPPGPSNLPRPLNYISAFASIFQNPITAIYNLSKRYGDVVYFNLGERTMVFLSTPELVNEILVKKADVTTGREPDKEFKAVLDYNGGVILSEGADWVDHRRFGLTALRNFGMGKRSLESRINEEARMLKDVFSSKGGAPVDPHAYFVSAVSNIICAITFGHRFEYSDPLFQKLTKDLNDIVAEEPSIIQYFPSFIRNGRRNKLLSIQDYMNKEVKEHEKTFDPNDVRDVIDMYISQVRELEKTGQRSELSMEKAWTMVFDFFLAGTETTSTTMVWAILFMAGYPDIQKKVVAEIQREIGFDSAPSYELQKKMPYTQAVLTEILRFRPIAPIGVPHRATADMKIKDYDIPKGTNIGMNILYIHHDPKVWGDPEVFRPERFLSKDGKSFVKHDAFMPFGAGRRKCLGEQLAKMEMFLFFTNIMQRFKVSLPPGTKADFSHGHRATTLLPKPYQVIFEERS